MGCIICFLGDDFQENLRNVSHQRAEKFEDVISEYKANFVAEFNHLDDVITCLKHSHYSIDTVKWVDEISNSLKKITDVDLYFDSLHDVYLTWINGNIKEPIEKLETIIKKHNLLHQINKPDKRIFFKGRYSKPYLNTEDLYHIPHNKRFLISNQRYSLTGQPIIYLGMSVIDVFAELKIQSSDFHDINFSSFVLKLEHTLKIFDFTSDFESRISDINNSTLLRKFDDPQSFTDEDIKRMFYKFILISLCSFKRRKESENWSFCEEYVLPQLITEISKHKGFDGILFYSTRVSKTLAFSEEVFYVSRHKENVALFTKYANNSNYDDELISKFEISKPIKFQDIFEIDSSELERIRRQINERESSNKKLNTLAPIADYADGLTTASFEKLMVRSFDNDSFVNYKNHPTGKMHYYLLYQILLTVRNRLT